MSDTTIIILFVVAIFAIYIGAFILKRLLMRGIDAGFDAVRNEKVRKEEMKNPPKQQSLADKYKDVNNNPER